MMVQYSYVTGASIPPLVALDRASFSVLFEFEDNRLESKLCKVFLFAGPLFLRTLITEIMYRLKKPK